MSGHRKGFSLMKNPKWWLVFILLSAGANFSLSASENLRLNPRLDYSSDRLDGALITGDHMEEAAVAGKPNYIIFYGEGCFNSKRQARRTVELYQKYKGRVQFVVIDLDIKRTEQQQELVKSYYRGYIPHVTVLDALGKAVYNSAGEVEESAISSILDASLKDTK
jgi:thiol-disulfide isomerase/thioredoxin